MKEPDKIGDAAKRIANLSILYRADINNATAIYDIFKTKSNIKMFYISEKTYQLRNGAIIRT